MDYATGALSEVWSFAIATHLSLCPDCRWCLSELEVLGPPAPIASDALDAVVALLEEASAAPITMLPSRKRFDEPHVLPEPLGRYIGGDVDDLEWQQLGLGACQFLITTGESGAVARLLRIPAVRPGPMNSYHGLELMLILSGAFFDATGLYRRPDLQEPDETLTHQPHTAPRQDCTCLTVTDTPLQFSSLAARLVQPFLGV